MDIVGNRTLYSIFRSHASDQPDRLWLTYESSEEKLSRWTFSEFLDTVHQAICLLQDLGIGAGDVINLHLTNHPAIPQVILAASYIGAIALPTSPSCSTEELRYFLEHSKSKLVITQRKYLGSVEAAAKETCSILLLQDG